MLLLASWRDTATRHRLLAIASVVIPVLGLLVAQPILIPYKSQDRSFKKSFMSIVQLLLPLDAYALERAILDIRMRVGAMMRVIALVGRADSRNSAKCYPQLAMPTA